MKMSKSQENLLKELEEVIRRKDRKKIDEIYEKHGLKSSEEPLKPLKPLKPRTHASLYGTKVDVVFSDDLFGAEKEAQNEGSD